MKKLLILAGFVFMTTAAHAGTTISCTGDAEYGAFKISKLIITDKNVILNFQKKGGPLVSKKYIIIERKRNGVTDIKTQPATFIGANTSGIATDYSDDMSLPKLGIYKSGLGSDIAFESGEGRVFGSISCQEL